MAEIKLNIQQGLESGNAKALRHVLTWYHCEKKKKGSDLVFGFIGNPAGMFWGSSGIPNEDHLIHIKKRGRKGG